jgi:type II secretory pathway component GspD/PulD (secretin)
MKRLLITLTVLSLALCSMAQNTDASKPATSVQTITVSSKGQDVREVLHDIFTQAKKSYVMEPNVHFVLYLSLTDMEFEEALNLICKTASLRYDLQNGIYFVNRASGAAPTSNFVHSSGKLPVTILRNKITVSYQKVDLRELFKDLAKQADVNIELAQGIPAYKLDVVLKDTSLKFALQTVCRAAGFSYRFTDHMSIEIFQPEGANHVTIK